MVMPYPTGAGGNPPALTPNTFAECNAALVDVFGTLSVLDTQVLSRWSGYAYDGDVTALPTAGGLLPWEELRAKRGPGLQHDASDVASDQLTLVNNWHSPASVGYIKYLGDMHDQLSNCAGAPGNSGGSAGTSGGGWVDQVAALLESAYTVQVAFKKDLYEIGNATYKVMKRFDDPFSWSTTEKIVMLLVEVAKVDAGAGGVAMAKAMSDMVFGKVLTSAASNSGEYAFAEGSENTKISGDHEWDIVASMDQAVSKALGKYKESAEKVTHAMDTLWQSLNEAATNPPRYGEVRSAPEVDRTRSFATGNYFPAAG